MLKLIIFCGVWLSCQTLYSQTATTIKSADTTAINNSDTTIVQTGINTVASEMGNTQQEERKIYRLKPAVDIPVTAISAGWCFYAFPKIYDKDPSTPQQIAALRKEDINGFDRWGADVFSKKAAETSDLFFYGSMPLPVILMLDKRIRKDAGKVAFLYLEAMSVTGLLYTGSNYLNNRYRPLTYNPEAGDERFGGGAKNSFFAGHVALVATSTFFTAKVFSDYHPDSKLRYLFYGAAIVSTGATGYLRHRGGKHFPSDILVGTAVGTLSGLLVPHFHKNKTLKGNRITLLPLVGDANGVSMVYKF